MMFKGTKRFPKGEIDFITARNGGNNNAFTSHDYTAYYFSFASDRWLAALEMEADRMENLLFDPTEFELEKQVILEEIKMGLDDPWEMLHQSDDLLGFRDHPYRFPIIGIEQDVMQLKIEDLRETYEAYYAPNNATLVVVGDIDTANIRSRIQDTFGQIEPSESPPANPENLTIQRESLRTRVERPSNIPRMLFALPAPKAASFQLYPAHLLDRVLSEGKLSRLYARLVEKEKLASTVATEIEETFVKRKYRTC
jgi:zinc protease